MQFRVLGSLAAVGDGAVAELGPPKQRALLAILLMHVGEIVPVDRLVDLLWGEDAPRTALHSIQIYVSELRKGLEPVGASELIVTRPPGYVLDAHRDSVDAWQFERLAREGARMLEAGDREGGRSALRRALALWHGPALSDFAYEEFAQPHIRRLNDLHLDAIEVLAAAELDAGRTAEALPLLTAAIQVDPLRERSRELLMLALYRSGRHADALRTFDQLRAQLAEELGIDPSPQIRALYDRILLHDPTLLPEPEAAARGAGEARNPYKGLRPFTEEDAADFFGRDRLVGRLLEALAGGTRLVSLVGPSGSGKSSVVAAGLVPRLRSGAIPGSQLWRIARMVPGANPLREAEALVGAGLPGSGQEDGLLLVIDQFEQVFTAAEEAAQDRFLKSLADAVTAPDARLRVILTLRADYYDRPLLHPAFAGVFTPSVVNVVPMTAGELEAAVVEPARRVGVAVEPGLLAELVADTADRPGSLPLLQYALTELFEQRWEPVLTRTGFARLGGLRGLLSRRAESLYIGLDGPGQEAAMQVFLRLVRPGSGAAESRRRVALAELTDLGIDPVVLSAVLTTFGRQRLLTFDRDPASGLATAEVAHEALLVEWERLAGWIERHRADLRRHGALIAAAEEWEASGQNPDYLFGGSRLDEFEPWLAGGVLQLSGRERAFLEAAVERRRAAEAEATASVDEQRRRERGTRRRFAALAGVVFLLAAALMYALVVGLGPSRPRVAMLAGEGVLDEMFESAFDEAVSDFELAHRKVKVADGESHEAALRDLSAEGPALVIISPVVENVELIVRDYPDTHYLQFGAPSSEPNVAAVLFKEWEAAFLAGVAAALESDTGRIGLVGGLDWQPIWGFAGGYEAGARAVRPDIAVLTRYLEEPNEQGQFTGGGFEDAVAAKEAARELYAEGADVVFQAAGQAGLGVFEAAVELSTAQRHLWAIGADSDQYETVTHLPGMTRGNELRQHILTSLLKRFDTIVYDALADVAAGTLPPSLQIYGLESSLVDITYTGGFIEESRPVIEKYRRQIVLGEIPVPCIPEERLDMARAAAEEFGVTFEEVRYCLLPPVP